MKSKCRAAIWWPGLDSDLERFGRYCTPCVVSRESIRRNRVFFNLYGFQLVLGECYPWTSPVSLSLHRLIIVS